MTRRFLHVLLALIAFQLSWNMLGAYCTHETGRAALHFGHHEHHASVDELTLAAKGQPEPVKKPVHDAHCCAGAHMSIAAPELLEAQTFLASVETRFPGTVLAPSSAFLVPPERPQWTGRA